MPIGDGMDESAYISDEDYNEGMRRHYEPPTQAEYKHVAKGQAQGLHSELFDLCIRYNLSALGELERNGNLTYNVGKVLNDALARLEILIDEL